MSTIRTARTHWEGSLTDGHGAVSLESSNLGTFDLTWRARAEEAGGKTSPEELIAAAHSGCLSMALSHALTQAGSPPRSIDTSAEVTFQPGTGITGVHLTVRAEVPGVDAAEFVGIAEQAKANCPVSQALAGTKITLDAALV